MCTHVAAGPSHPCFVGPARLSVHASAPESKKRGRHLILSTSRSARKGWPAEGARGKRSGRRQRDDSVVDAFDRNQRGPNSSSTLRLFFMQLRSCLGRVPGVRPSPAVLKAFFGSLLICLPGAEAARTARIGARTDAHERRGSDTFQLSVGARSLRRLWSVESALIEALARASTLPVRRSRLVPVVPSLSKCCAAGAPCVHGSCTAGTAILPRSGPPPLQCRPARLPSGQSRASACYSFSVKVTVSRHLGTAKFQFSRPCKIPGSGELRSGCEGHRESADSLGFLFSKRSLGFLLSFSRRTSRKSRRVFALRFRFSYVESLWSVVVSVLRCPVFGVVLGFSVSPLALVARSEPPIRQAIGSGSQRPPSAIAIVVGHVERDSDVHATPQTLLRTAWRSG